MPVHKNGMDSFLFGIGTNALTAFRRSPDAFVLFWTKIYKKEENNLWTYFLIYFNVSCKKKKSLHIATLCVSSVMSAQPTRNLHIH